MPERALVTQLKENIESYQKYCITGDSMMDFTLRTIQNQYEALNTEEKSNLEKYLDKKCRLPTGLDILKKPMAAGCISGTTVPSLLYCTGAVTTVGHLFCVSHLSFFASCAVTSLMTKAPTPEEVLKKMEAIKPYHVVVATLLGVNHEFYKKIQPDINAIKELEDQTKKTAPRIESKTA